MKNIRIIKTGIDVSKIKAQLEQYKDDWGIQKKEDGIAIQDPKKYLSTVDVLQLVMGGIEHMGEYVGDTEICVPTPAFKRHTAILELLRDELKVPTVRRCAFFSIPVGHKVGKHIDFGTYYLNKDRYHVSISGRYKYTVYGKDGVAETVIIEPGTFFWFDNKLEHESENIADEPRVAFIFDVPMSDLNP